MKKVFAICSLVFFLTQNLSAQEGSVRPKAFGVSFILNDFISAQRIRSSSLSRVLSDKRYAKIKDMAPGLALTYFQGLKKHIDLSVTAAASFINYPLPGKAAGTRDALLVEVDASANFKLFSDAYWVSPYLIAGVGASMYKNKYGAIIPLGAGIKFNLFDEAAVFISGQYRVPATAENANYHFVYSLGIAGIIGK